MFVFRKIWRALFSCNTCFEICPFALLLMKYKCFTLLIYGKNSVKLIKKLQVVKNVIYIL